MAAARTAGLAALVLLAAACVRRTSTDDSQGSAGPGTDDAAATGGTSIGASGSGAIMEEGGSSEATGDDAPSTTAPPIACEEGFAACGDVCTLTCCDPSNCGECGHACKGWGTTRNCSGGACEPGIWPCILRDQGISTCAEACASVGEQCPSDAYCSGAVRVWMTASPNDSNPEAMIESCKNLGSGTTSFTLGCNDPIDWSYESLGKTVVGVACCCTQP
jgi:hypothetical protein